MNRRRNGRSRLLLLAACLLLSAPVCNASFIFTISVDTSALIGHPAGPFYIEFQLNDGSGTGNGNNTALLGTFDFAGGAPVGSPILIGGASGDLSSHVVLSDDDFLNEFIQQFTPGPLLTFAVELSTVVELGPQPDQFSFAILDCNLFEIPTMGPADALVIADITSQPVARAFASDLSRTSGCGGGPIPVTVLQPPIPEPMTLPLLVIAILAMRVAMGLRARARPSAPPRRS
jgi:hypothetical protein